MANAAPVLSLEVSQIATAIQHHLRYTLGSRVQIRHALRVCFAHSRWPYARA